MNYDKQRRQGVRAAIAARADQTLAAIRDLNNCYGTIMKTAIEETSVETLVEHVLDNDPEWAYRMLTLFPDLDPHHRKQLVAKTAEGEEAAISTLRFVPHLEDHEETMLTQAAGKLAHSMGEISAFSLIDQAWYNAEFTVFWVDQGQVQPAATIPKSQWGKWKWSEKLSGGGGTVKMNISEFAVEDKDGNTVAPQPGNEVWMYMWVQAGDDFESPLRFTYNPNTEATANFTATGTTKSTRLSLTNIT
ncbi:MAG: hypothetical protein AAF433_13865 [Bacteroidota bacterium]